MEGFGEGQFVFRLTEEQGLGVKRGGYGRVEQVDKEGEEGGGCGTKIKGQVKKSGSLVHTPVGSKFSFE